MYTVYHPGVDLELKNMYTYIFVYIVSLYLQTEEAQDLKQKSSNILQHSIFSKGVNLASKRPGVEALDEVMLEVEVTKEVASIFSAGTWQSSVKSSNFAKWGQLLKWWVFPQQPLGFPTKNDQHLGCEMGVPPFKEAPKYLAVGVGTSMIHADIDFWFFSDPVS